MKKIDANRQYGQIINFNTSYGTRNIGDYIIAESIFREMDFLFKDNFIINLPTHTPVALPRQTINISPLARTCSCAKLKFIDGTNIIKQSLLRPWPDWNISLLTKKPYKNSILIGAGLGGNFEKVDLYTKYIYNSIFSKEYIHSTRDEKTKKFLERLGLKAINTGCATMWCLTEEHCAQIPKQKGKAVVFTLTDYCKDKNKDRQLIDTLKNNYEKIYFWIQGSGDYEYIQEITDIDNIGIISPNLNSYKEVLASGNIDYVGTRLHAGIYALQHKVRSIILAVDNRAIDMKETYNLIVLKRDRIDKLDALINSEFSTNAKIDEQRIEQWKAQFR